MPENWKTTLFGLISAISVALKAVVPAPLAPVLDAISLLAIALLGYFAADKT